jgi:hypothetical protein
MHVGDTERVRLRRTCAECENRGGYHHRHTGQGEIFFHRVISSKLNHQATVFAAIRTCPGSLTLNLCGAAGG